MPICQLHLPLRISPAQNKKESSRDSDNFFAIRIFRFTTFVDLSLSFNFHYPKYHHGREV